MLGRLPCWVGKPVPTHGHGRVCVPSPTRPPTSRCQQPPRGHVQRRKVAEEETGRGGFSTSPVDPGAPQLMYKAESIYNDNIQVIQIPDVPELNPALESLRGSRILVLDRTGNIHSVYNESKFISGSYWDFLATMPQFCPDGTIGILGLGAGTVARMISHYYEDAVMAGWELDPVVVLASRMCFGVLDLEDSSLTVHTGDALLPTSTINGGFNSAIVDIFSQGKLCPQLMEADTWKRIKQRLKPDSGARVMVNLGASPYSKLSSEDSADTIKALDSMMEVFDGEVNVIHISNLDRPDALNTIALTGPLVGLQEAWTKDIPEDLKRRVEGYTWERWSKDTSVAACD